MKLKDKIITFIICSIVLCVYIIVCSYNTMTNEVNKIYKVYLAGNLIGNITDKDALYELIDNKQQVIKDKYNVKNVYPPNALQIIETYTYNDDITNINEIYNKLEESQDFTISGYEIKFSATSSHEEFNVYVLDKEIFTEALKKFVLAFVDEESFTEYINGTQEELSDIGIFYKDMGLEENVSIRKKYISIDEKIYDNSEELAQELLFGFNHKEQSYVIKEGDTIESISESNSLNTQEFLIANPRYSSKDSLLAIGDTVNLTLINPELSFQYTVSEIKEVEKDFSTSVVRDNTKPSTYSEITTPGVKGLSLITSHYSVVNGEPSSEAEIDDEVVIREVVNQVTTKGKKNDVWGWNVTEDTGTGWRWPTSNPYVVTSEFAYRWGKHHNGIDISGSGFGSKIYAVGDGTVTKVSSGCADVGSYPNSCGGGFGNYIVINHGNNLYTVYAHITSKINVREGQSVSRGTVIGYMGSSGQSTGTHLHFGVSVGDPTNGGTYQNPRNLYR